MTAGRRPAIFHPLRSVLLASLAAAPALASLEDGLPAPGAAADSAQAYESRHNLALAFPRLLWTWLVYPLGQATIYAEHEQVPKRARELFTNAAGTFGIFPQLQLGGETDTGVAARLFHTDLLGGGQRLEALYVFSATARQRAEWLYRDPHLGGGGLYWELAGEYLDTDHEDATVNGAAEGLTRLAAALGDRPHGEALFALRRLDAGLALGWRTDAGPLEEYRPAFTVELRGALARRRLESLLAALPDLRGPASTATAAAVPGLGQEVTYGRVGARLAWDDRDAAAPVRDLVLPLNHQLPGRVLLEREGLHHSFRNLAYPEGGGLAELTFDVARGSRGVRFARLGAEVQRFRTLFWKERVLAARARLDKVFPAGDGMAPYEDLPTLGGSHRQRGYERGAFRGEGALLLALEYRWPVWDTWNAFLFQEEGQVFDAFGDLEADGFDSSTGAGLVLRSEKAFLLSLRLAHSARRKALVGFSLEQEF